MHFECLVVLLNRNNMSETLNLDNTPQIPKMIRFKLNRIIFAVIRESIEGKESSLV